MREHVAIQRRADAEKAVVAKANRAEDRRGEAEQSAFWLADMKRKQQVGGPGAAGAGKGEMKGALSGFGGKMSQGILAVGLLDVLDGGLFDDRPGEAGGEGGDEKEVAHRWVLKCGGHSTWEND